MVLETEKLTNNYGIIIYPSILKIKDLDIKIVKNLYKEYGVIYFKDFELSLQDMISFSEKFDESFISYSGGAVSREIVEGNSTVVYAVAGSKPGDPISFHGEQYYQKEKPDTLWFYCETPVDFGGQTTITDGCLVFKSLKLQYQNKFRSKKIVIKRFMTESKWKKIYNCNSIEELSVIFKRQGFDFDFCTSNNSVSFRFITSAIRHTNYQNQIAFVNNLLGIMRDVSYLHPKVASDNTVYASFEDGEEISDDILNDIDNAAQKHAYGINWKKGEMLILDNSRMMHGRSEFTDLNRKIVARLSVIR